MRRALVATIVAAAFAAPAALATWSSTAGAGPMTVSTATLADPTGLAAANNKNVCLNNTASSLEVDLTWTPTASPRASGYVVLRNGTQVATLSGASTSGWNDTTGQLAFATSYTYVVESSVAGWTSPGTTATTAITTLAHNCK
jgi:hypothetical protein